MSELFIRYLSLSISGLLLALVLFALKPFIKNKVSKTWQYYIWMIVIIRMLVPFAPRVEMMDKQLQHTDNSIIVQEKTSSVQNSPTINVESPTFKPIAQEIENTIHTKSRLPNDWNIVIDNIWMLWIGIALILFTYKMIVYISFIRYMKANKVVVKDPEVLGIFRNVCNEVGNKATLNMYTSDKVVSPMLLGIIRPFIVLPNTDIKEFELRNIVMHELIHYKRLDIIYKWITQIAVCLHWFNPIIYFISKEINKSCELSCDEAIIKKMDADGKRQYGNTLLASVKINGISRGTGISLSLNKDAKLLKERLSSIMTFKSKTKLTTAFTILLTLTLFLCSTLMSSTVMAAIPSTTIHENSPLQNVTKSSVPALKMSTETQLKLHPDNTQLASINSEKITKIKININAASVYLKTTDANTFRLCYTGRANKSYKASADVSGNDNNIVTINIKGKPMKITSPDDLIDFDSVTLEIPDKAYGDVSIEDIEGNLSICEINAPMTVSDKEGIINLKHSELKRGSYVLKTNKGIINVKLNTLLTQLYVDTTEGIGTIKFNEEPTPGEFLLNIVDGKNSILLPKGWNQYITKKASDVKDSPSLSLNNHKGIIKVKVNNSSKEDSVLMKTANVLNETYYLIESEEDLRAIGHGSYSLSDNYMLNKDITLTKEWEAIGSEKHPFTGKFDGNGYKISNLTTTDKKAKYIGLFGFVEGGTIHNVTLSKVDIESAGDKGHSNGTAAIVVIAMDSDISDCHIE